MGTFSKSALITALVILAFSQGANAQVNQNFAIAESIREQAENCAEGQEGTIGDAIAQAQEAHLRLASTTVNTDRYFDIENNCFSKLGNMADWDLSDTMPDFGNWWGRVQQALIRFAERRICSAVNEVVSSATESVNGAIEDVGQMRSIGDLNGLTNSMTREGLSRIDPGLGREYRNARGRETYNINVFNPDQTRFDGEGGGNEDGQSGNAAQGAALKSLKSNSANGGRTGSSDAVENTRRRFENLSRSTEEKMNAIKDQIQRQQQADGLHNGAEMLPYSNDPSPRGRSADSSVSNEAPVDEAVESNQKDSNDAGDSILEMYGKIFK